MRQFRVAISRWIHLDQNIYETGKWVLFEVEILEATGRLGGHVQSLLGRQLLPVVAELVLDRSAVAVLHHEEVRHAVDDEPEELDDVLVIVELHHAGLLHHLVEGLLVEILAVFRLQPLGGDRLVVLEQQTAEDGPVGATSDPLHHLDVGVAHLELSLGDGPLEGDLLLDALLAVLLDHHLHIGEALARDADLLSLLLHLVALDALAPPDDQEQARLAYALDVFRLETVVPVHRQDLVDVHVQHGAMVVRQVDVIRLSTSQNLGHREEVATRWERCTTNETILIV